MPVACPGSKCQRSSRLYTCLKRSPTDKRMCCLHLSRGSTSLLRFLSFFLPRCFSAVQQVNGIKNVDQPAGRCTIPRFPKFVLPLNDLKSLHQDGWTILRFIVVRASRELRLFSTIWYLCQCYCLSHEVIQLFFEN